MTKSKPKVIVVDCTTGEQIVRDATVEEIAQMEIDATYDAQLKFQNEAKATQRQAILDRLGLTADEAKLILG